MNNSFHFTLIAFLIYCPALSAMNALKKKQEEIVAAKQRKENLLFTTLKTKLGERQLIILFDHVKEEFSSCENWQALGNAFRAALTNEVPILTSRWLFQDLKKCTFDPLNNWHVYETKPFPINKKDEPAQLAEPKEDEPAQLAEPKKNEPAQFAEPMMLFIRKDSPHLNELDNYSMGGEYNNAENQPQKISDGEHLLGLKISNCTEITDGISSQGEPNSNIKIVSNANIKQYLQQILITHQDVKGLKEDYLNRWDIYLQGHGGQYIAGMPKASFEAMLDFLNFGINTRSLFYLTCYSGGQNLTTPYQYESETPYKNYGPQDKDLNYMIISANIFNTQTWTSSWYPSQAFNNYFTTLDSYFKSPKQSNLLKIFEYLGDVWQITFKSENPNNVLQLPTIRFPHAVRFAIVDLSKGTEEQKKLFNVFKINDQAIRASFKAAITKTEINIPEDIQMILVESPYIPVPVNINSATFPRIIPIVQNCFFKEIIATKTSFYSEEPKTTTFISRMKELTTIMHATNNFYIEQLTTSDHISPNCLFDVHIDLESEEVKKIERQKSDLSRRTLDDKDFTPSAAEYGPHYLWRFTNTQRQLWNASKLPLDVKGEFPEIRGTPKNDNPVEEAIENPVFKMKPKTTEQEPHPLRE